MRLLLIIWVYLFAAVELRAQVVVQGVVTDSGTHAALEMATVTVSRDTVQGAVAYTQTDAGGHFRIEVPDRGKYWVNVLFMGYRKAVLPARFDAEMHIKLAATDVLLKEVKIVGGRVFGRQDTVKYDFSRFATDKDRNVKDVLRKLPGVDVDEESGQVRYKGKPISHFYVEGMDVTGGSYNQVNDNLKADAVQQAEIIEHYQPIRSLRNKVPTDNTALNLRLKPEVRSKWLFNIQASAGVGDEALYGATANAMQLARGRQGLYTYKNDHTGRDLANELQTLANDNVLPMETDVLPVFVAPGTLSFPLEKRRLADNTTHLLSVNRLYQRDEMHQKRFSFRYLHDEQRRLQGTDETYYYGGDTIRTDRQQDYRLQTHQLNGDYNYEHNGEKSFVRNLLNLSAEWQRSDDFMQGDRDVVQRAEDKQFSLLNRFNWLLSSDACTWGFRSLLHYTGNPSRLRFDAIDQSIDVHQAYTDNQGYFLRKKNGVSLSFTAGMQGTLAFICRNTTYDAHRLRLYATPLIGWESTYFRINASADAWWERLASQNAHALHLDPRIYLRYAPTNRWEIYASAQWQHFTDMPGQFYPYAYWTDYRTTIDNSGKPASRSMQSYMLSTSYKRTVQEFFWTLDVSYSRNRYNRLTSTYYTDGIFRLTQLDMRHHASAYSLSTQLSKGFYALRLKSSLEASVLCSEGEQAGQGMVQRYRYRQFRLLPKLGWSPFPAFDVAYQGTFACSASTIGERASLPTLWNIRQRITLGTSFCGIGLNVAAEHYYNQLTSTDSSRAWFADVSADYRTGRWRFEAGLSNLFDRREYRYTLYSELQSITSWMKTRPREVLFTIAYSL